MSTIRTHVVTREIDLSLVENGDGSFVFEVDMYEKPSTTFPDGRRVKVARRAPIEAMTAAWDLMGFGEQAVLAIMGKVHD